MQEKPEFETMLAKEAFDLVSLGVFLAGLVLAGLAMAVLL